MLEYDEGQKEITIFIFFTSSRPQPIPIYLQDIDFSFDPFFWSKLGVLRYLFLLDDANFNSSDPEETYIGQPTAFRNSTLL